MKTVGKTIERPEPEIAKIREDVYVVPSRSNVGTLHVVKIVNGRAVCGCDGSYFSGRCYHEAAVAEYISAAKRPPTALGLSLLTGGKLGSR